jgi:autophagy-related protein 9
VYEYHQKHGFTVMMLQELLELIQFIFMILFTVFLVECIDYPLLFKDKLPPEYHGEKLHLSQIVALRPFADMALLTKAFVLVSVAFWTTRVIVVVIHGFQFWEIKARRSYIT